MSKNIIIRVPNWIGDAIMATPALSYMRKAFPDSEITVMCRNRVREIFANNVDVDGIVSCDKKTNETDISDTGTKGNEYLIGGTFKSRKYRDQADRTSERPRISMIGFTGERKYDIGLLLVNSFSSALTFKRMKIKNIVGYNTECRGIMLTRSVPFREKKHLHRTYQYLYLAQYCADNFGETVSHAGLFVFKEDASPAYPFFIKPELKFNATEESNKRAEQLLGNIKNDIIAVNPCATAESRRWMPERFAQVIDRIKSELQHEVVLLGSKDDIQTINRVLKHSKTSPINLGGKTDLPTLASVLKRCKFLLTNDSGVMHVSCAVGIPVIDIIGAADEKVTGPYGVKSILVRKPLPCAPCVKNKCGKKRIECMELITVDDVYSAVLEMVNAHIILDKQGL